MKHLYDADKKRTVKLSGNNEAVYVNTIPSANETQTDRFTIYPNPYMVFTNGGRYTKHIYIGSERIVSKVSIDNGYDPRTAQTAAYGNNSYVTKLNNKSAALNDSVEAIYTKFQLPFNGLNNDDIIQGFQPALRSMISATSSSTDNYEEYSYYIHSDHLGSSSYITDTDGEVSQHVEYVPFGEVFIEELSSSAKLNTPFLFNGKELDEETGLYYYGARYYDPRTSLWLSTDPMELKYPNVSTYAYCLNNPVKMIDFKGAFPIFINGRVSSNNERASSNYWDISIRELVKKHTGYYHSQFRYVDGDKGVFAQNRYNAGIAKGVEDAVAMYEILKSTAKDNVISEQIQIFSHSRGSAFASGYMLSLSSEIQKLAKLDNMSFSYDTNNIIEYSVNIAPHQSNSITYENTGTINVNISHYGDILSGNDAKGNVINIHSCMKGFEQHGHATYLNELDFILPILENGGSKTQIINKLKLEYNRWNSIHQGQKESIVK